MIFRGITFSLPTAPQGAVGRENVIPLNIISLKMKNDKSAENDEGIDKKNTSNISI